MRKNYIVGLSTLALLSGIYVTYSAHAIEANACLEMYCPRGCDLNYRNTGSPRCCRENEHLGLDGHCTCVYESCEDKCCKENEVCRADKTCGPCITTKDCNGNDVCRTDGTCGGCTIHKDCEGNEYCDTTDTTCKICPSGDGWGSTQDGTGDSTNIDGCKCVAPQTLWTGSKCMTPIVCTSKCDTCKKCDMTKGKCVADSSKNGQSCGTNMECNDGECELKGCILGDKQYAPGSLVGNCGKCTEDGTIVANTNATFDKDCQKCSQSTNWLIENILDGTPVIDACKVCKNGKVAYIDTNKTLSCGAGPGALCCAKNQTCSQDVHGNPICVAPCKDIGDISTFRNTGKTGTCKTGGRTCGSRPIQEMLTDKTFTPQTNMVLHAHITGVLNGYNNQTFSFSVYDQTTRNYLEHNPSLVNIGGYKVGNYLLGYLTDNWADGLYNLEAGHTYQIDTDFYTMCGPDTGAGLSIMCR